MNPDLRGACCSANWIGVGPGSIDPEKEVRAAERRVALGISTLAAESFLHDGVDWEIKHAQRVKDVTKRREARIEMEPATKQSSREPASPDPGVPEP
jgi:capsid protein